MCTPSTIDINLGGQGLDVGHVKLLMDRLTVEPNSVRKLNLAGNKLGDDGAKMIADQVAQLCELTHLHLAKNGIGDEGAEAVRAAVEQLPCFRGLDLRNNPCR